MGTWTEAHRLFKLAIAAEDAFSKALRARFGDMASEARYYPRGKRWPWDAELRCLAAAKQAADQRYLEECAAVRAREGW